VKIIKFSGKLLGIKLIWEITNQLHCLSTTKYNYSYVRLIKFNKNIEENPKIIDNFRIKINSPLLKSTRMAGIVNTSNSINSNADGKNYTLPLIILTTLFFMWGFITCMNDILMPYLQGIFKLTAFEVGFIQTAFFGAYFFVSLAYFLISTNLGDPLAKIGYQNGVILGLVTAGIGCLLFYPAAEAKLFWVFLVALFVLAAGITILQMAANPYVSLLGSSESASSRLNMTQAFNSLGTTIAPIIGAKLIFESIGGKEHMTADNVKAPYLALAGVLFLLAVVFALSKLPKFTGEKIEKGLGVLKFSHLTYGVLGIFMYVGGEVAIGSYLVKYFDGLMGFNEATAANFVSFYWGGAMVGRFIGAISLTERKPEQKLLFQAVITIIAVAAVYLITKDVTISTTVLALIVGNIVAFQIGKSAPANTLGIFASIVICLLITTVFASGSVAMWAVLAIGLFNSIMFPTIFTLAIRDLGKYTSQGSSLLVMAIVGGAIATPLMGALVEAVGYQKAFLLPIVSYLYISFYGFKGYRVKKNSTSSEESTSIALDGSPALQV